MPKTTFKNKCSILADLWLNHRDDENLEDFISYSDLGLPLAYLMDNDYVVKVTDEAKSFINEAFELLLDTLGLDDEGFESIDEILEMEE